MLDKVNPLILPPALQDAYTNVENNFYKYIKTGELEKSISQWNRLYNEFLQFQEELNVRYHKGGVLHNIGISYLFGNNIQDGFKNFLLAYAEDVATQLDGFGGPAEECPAAKNLVSLYGVQESTFNLVREAVNNHIQDKVYWNPRILLNEFLQTEFSEATNKENTDELENTFLNQKKHSINAIPGKWNERVFVGGNYSKGTIRTLIEITKAVEDKGYTPIIDSQFNDTEPTVHDHALLLLHSCKYAIFDVSDDSGFLMEVERTLDYRTETLLVYKNHPDFHITAMIKTMKKNMNKFSTYESLRDLVDNFLP